MKLSKSRISEIIQEEIHKRDKNKNALIREAPAESAAVASPITARERQEMKQISSQWSFIALVMEDPSIFDNVLKTYAETGELKRPMTASGQFGPEFQAAMERFNQKAKAGWDAQLPTLEKPAIVPTSGQALIDNWSAWASLLISDSLLGSRFEFASNNYTFKDEWLQSSYDAAAHLLKSRADEIKPYIENTKRCVRKLDDYIWGPTDTEEMLEIWKIIAGTISVQGGGSSPQSLSMLSLLLKVYAAEKTGFNVSTIKQFGIGSVLFGGMLAGAYALNRTAANRLLRGFSERIKKKGMSALSKAKLEKDAQRLTVEVIPPGGKIPRPPAPKGPAPTGGISDPIPMPPGPSPAGGPMPTPPPMAPPKPKPKKPKKPPGLHPSTQEPPKGPGVDVTRDEMDVAQILTDPRTGLRQKGQLVGLRIAFKNWEFLGDAIGLGWTFLKVLMGAAGGGLVITRIAAPTLEAIAPALQDYLEYESATDMMALGNDISSQWGSAVPGWASENFKALRDTSATVCKKVAADYSEQGGEPGPIYGRFQALVDIKAQGVMDYVETDSGPGGLPPYPPCWSFGSKVKKEVPEKSEELVGAVDDAIAGGYDKGVELASKIPVVGDIISSQLGPLAGLVLNAKASKLGYGDVYNYPGKPDEYYQIGTGNKVNQITWPPVEVIPEGHDRLRKKIRMLILCEDAEAEAEALRKSLAGTGAGGEPPKPGMECAPGTSGVGCTRIDPQSGEIIPPPLPPRVEPEPEVKPTPVGPRSSRTVIKIEKIINVSRPSGRWEKVQVNPLWWKFIDANWNWSPGVHGAAPWGADLALQDGKGLKWSQMVDMLEGKGITGFTARPAGALKFLETLRDDIPFSGNIKKMGAPEGPKDLLGPQQTGKRKTPSGLVTIVKDDGMIHQVEKSSGFNVPLPRPTGMNVPPASPYWQPPLHGGVKVILLKSAVPRGVTPYNLQQFEIIVNPFLGGVFGKISSLSTTTWKKRIAWAVRSWLQGLSQNQLDMLFKL